MSTTGRGERTKVDGVAGAFGSGIGGGGSGQRGSFDDDVADDPVYEIDRCTLSIGLPTHSLAAIKPPQHEA